MTIKTAQQQVSHAKDLLADEIESEFPIGTKVRVSWMHDSKPLVRIVRLMAQQGGFRGRFLEDVPHRIAGKPPIRKAGDTETMAVHDILEKCAQ
jgi:hypothetical protein